MLFFHPQHDQGASFSPRSALSAHVDSALEQIRALSIPLIEELERRHPGHPFGWKKFEHMEQMKDEVLQLASDLGLTDREIHLLRLIARAHDIGRHKEALNQLDTLRPGPRHGHLSAALLLEHRVLDSLDPADREVVLGAVIDHAEREVSLPPGTARTLCYVIRDTERLDIFRDPKNRSREGILEQISLHYLEDKERAEISRKEVRDYVLGHLFDVPMDTAACPGTFGPSTRAALERTATVMTTGVTPALLDQFCEMRPLAVQDIRNSYTSYELYQLAFIFDMQSRGILETIQRERLLEGKLDFLARRLPPSEMTRINEAIDGYLKGRGVRG